MKLFCALAFSVALASATTPPRIELDLAGKRLTNSQKDYAARCPAGSSTIKTCPFPVARAYDHKEGDLTSKIVTKVYRVDLDGTPCNHKANPAECEVSTVNFGYRSTYVFEYDVSDTAGNRAEQVVFELVLDDIVMPTITMCKNAGRGGRDFETWEAAGADQMCRGATARDNIDDAATMQGRLRYQLFSLDENSNSVRICPPANPSEGKSYAKWRNDPRFIDYTDAGLKSCADKELKTDNVGRYLLTLKTCDKAGTRENGSSGAGFQYSANPPYDNCVTSSKAIVIQDTTVPVITVHGYGESSPDSGAGDPLLHECATPYTETYPNAAPFAEATNGPDFSVTVTDALDDNLKALINVRAKITLASGTVLRSEKDNTVPPLPVGDLGTYTIRYDATDSNGNPATYKSRTVEVRDTTNPKVTLIGETKMTHHVYQAPGHLQDPFATCEDTCDTTIGAPVATWDKPWNERVIGCYLRTYTCTDASGNSAATERTICIEDHGDPIITVMGDQDMTIEASNSVEYTDEGATCQDYVDGVLSHAVEVSGNVVNLRIPGEYTIKYDCLDLSGRSAEQQERKVTVVDTTCPTISIKGSNTIYLEAGFKYVDEGATAHDSLNGELDVTTVNANIETSNKYHRSRSCREIKAAASDEGEVATTGYYYITTATDAGEFKRIRVFCDMDKGATYKKCEIDCPANKEKGCAALGLKVFKWNSGGKRKCWITGHKEPGCQQNPIFEDLFTSADEVRAYVPVAGQQGATDRYLCGTNDEGEDGAANKSWDNASGDFKAHGHDWTAEQAEYGKFVISYHTVDKSGNTEHKRADGSVCGTTPKRTVIVKDTLPPVISLHLKGHGRIQQSASKQLGIGGAAYQNTAHTKTWVNAASEMVQNSFMAEKTTGANSWVIGAAASAVAGLALLGLSLRKKQSTVVEV